MLVLVGVLLLGACGGDEDDAADTSATPTTAPRGEPAVIRTRMIVAAAERAEPIATGEVLEESTLGDSPFCAGGTVLDSHGSTDPSVWLIVETITCPDGTVKLRVKPNPAQGLNQTGCGRSSAAPAPSSGYAGAVRWRSCTTPTTTRWLT